LRSGHRGQGTLQESRPLTICDHPRRNAHLSNPSDHRAFLLRFALKCGLERNPSCRSPQQIANEYTNSSAGRCVSERPRREVWTARDVIDEVDLVAHGVPLPGRQVQGPELPIYRSRPSKRKDLGPRRTVRRPAIRAAGPRCEVIEIDLHPDGDHYGSYARSSLCVRSVLIPLNHMGGLEITTASGSTRQILRNRWPYRRKRHDAWPGQSS